MELWVPTATQARTPLRLLPRNEEVGQWCFNYQLLTFVFEHPGTDWHCLPQHTLALISGAFVLWSRFPFHIPPPTSPLFFCGIPRDQSSYFQTMSQRWERWRIWYRVIQKEGGGITGITLHSHSTNSPKSCYCNIKHSWNISHWSLWVFSSINISL